MTAQTKTGPLNGIRVLDLTRILAGPTCTQLFGDLGADIIKIERPQSGDDTRTWGPPFVKDEHGNDSRESAYYLCANRNKRSVAIDISDPKGANLIKQLAQHCDILIENFKVGGLKKYGLDYASLKDEFPNLIYCSISGFGQTGPNAHKAGYDLMAQGYGGMMSLTGEPDGEPMKVAVGVADVVCGMYASTAILAALRHRDLTGQSQHIDLGLVDTQISWLINAGTNYLTDHQPPKRQGNQHANIVPYQVFKVSDGHIIVAVGNDGQYQRFCQLLDHPQLATDKRFATNRARLENKEILVPLLKDILLGWEKHDLLKKMDDNGIPAGPINTVPEVFETDQVKARDMKITMDHPTAQSGSVDLIGNPLKLSETPVQYNRPPPLLGEHTKEVLSELLGPETYRKAKADNIID